MMSLTLRHDVRCLLTLSAILLARQLNLNTHRLEDISLATRRKGEAGEKYLSFFLSIQSRSNFDHHLRCGGWLNFEFSNREKHSGWAIKTIYKKLCRGMLKHIPLYQ